MSHVTCHYLSPRVSGLGALPLSAGHPGAPGGGGGQGKPQGRSAQQVSCVLVEKFVNTLIQRWAEKRQEQELWP